MDPKSLVKALRDQVSHSYDNMRGNISETYDTLTGDLSTEEKLNWYLDKVSKGAAQALPMLSKDPQDVTLDDLMMSGVGPSALAIKAFHGSPHKFDAFDMSKIGTGEGAQAYGHGLYFAESPEVAKGYQEALRNPIELDGAKPDRMRMGFAHDSLLNMMQNRLAAKLPIEQARKQTLNWAKNNKQIISDLDENQINEFLSRVSQGEGNLYKTSLEWPDQAREAADPMGPQHFLDWDKPLSEQGDFVKNILNPENYNKQITDIESKYKNENINDLFSMDLFSSSMSKEDLSLIEELTSKLKSIEKFKPILSEANNSLDASTFINRVKNTYSPDVLSDELKKLGIPGIRYLDGGSRGTGEGSSNYVVFDDKIPKIVERNGKPVNALVEALRNGN